MQFCIKTGFRKYDFSEITQNIYDSPEKITALIKEKTAEKRSCTNFIYISGCAEKFEKFDFELIKKEVRYLTNIFKALDELSSESEIHFLYFALYEKELSVFAASVQSYLHSFMMVNSEIKTSAAAIQENDPDKLIKAAAYELSNIEISKKKFTVYENEKKYSEYVDSFDISSGHSLLKENGVYLIVGGCGKLGRTLAKYISERYRQFFIAKTY